MQTTFVNLDNGTIYKTEFNEGQRVRKCEDVLIAREGKCPQRAANSSEHKLAANHMDYYNRMQKQERIQLMKHRLEQRKMKK